MFKDFDLSLVSRIVFLAIVAMLVGYIFMSLSDKSDTDRQIERITEAFQKAIAQCYALEGSYPPDLQYLEKYGVVMDEDKYFYMYSLDDMGNYMPAVFIAAR